MKWVRRSQRCRPVTINSMPCWVTTFASLDQGRSSEEVPLIHLSLEIQDFDTPLTTANG